MYEHDDVLIIGDSFCFKRSTFDHWPKILYFKLTNIDFKQPKGCGYNGCSWWSIRKRLLTELKIKIPKILVICHTEPNRIASENDIPSSLSYCMRHFDESKLSNNYHSKNHEVYKATIEYYKHLNSTDFNLWCQKQWFNELDSILENYNIEKIIHLYCFKPRRGNNPHIFKNGITITTPLMEYVDDINSIDTLIYPNHLTIKNNHQLAISLFDILSNKYVSGTAYLENLIG